jgi:hypothetical protein
MKCRECGTEIADKALICFRCGAAVTEPVTQPYVAKKKRPVVVYVVFAILVLLGLLLLYFRPTFEIGRSQIDRSPIIRPIAQAPIAQSQIVTYLSGEVGFDRTPGVSKPGASPPARRRCRASAELISRGSKAMAQKDIQSVLQEDRVFPPSAQFLKAATLKAGELQAMYAKAEHDYVGFWADSAREEIDWHRPFTVALDESQAPNYRWFTDGQLNVSHNCLDMNLPQRGDKLAIVFEGEPGDVRTLTYAQLHGEVCRFANALKALRIGRGDRVVVYMPLIPEAVIAMQACARIGAIHSVVFGGFSANAVKDRIEDAGAKLVITADGGWRGGQSIELKRAVDKALAEGCPTVRHVVVYTRTGVACPMRAGRDVRWQDAVSGQSAACEPEWVDAEHPLFLLYTSGSTGKPKGVEIPHRAVVNFLVDRITVYPHARQKVSVREKSIRSPSNSGRHTERRISLLQAHIGSDHPVRAIRRAFVVSRYTRSPRTPTLRARSSFRARVAVASPNAASRAIATEASVTVTAGASRNKSLLSNRGTFNSLIHLGSNAAADARRSPPAKSASTWGRVNGGISASISA